MFKKNNVAKIQRIRVRGATQKLLENFYNYL